jgi:hypothetical protein
VDIWKQLGFSQNPYETTPLPCNAEGRKLLVGRDSEVQSLVRRISSASSHQTIAGDNGVGKTSLIAVVQHELGHLGDKQRPYFFPIGDAFQLTEDDTAQGFERRVFYNIAKAFIDNHDDMKKVGLKVPDTHAVVKWLMEPTFTDRSAGVQVLGSGANVTVASQPNSGAGFAEVGFESIVRPWLDQCFGSTGSAGLVAVLDNLELIRSSQHTRTVLEALRDRVFGIPGLRWILSGTADSLAAVTSSRRFEGILNEPTLIAPLHESWTPEVVSRRLEVFGGAASAAPVDQFSFRHLYQVLNYNLRITLRYCEDYSFYLVDSRGHLGYQWVDFNERRAMFERWLRRKARGANAGANVDPGSLMLFDAVCKRREDFTIGDWRRTGSGSLQACRESVKQLVDQNLMRRVDVADDPEGMRYGVTPHGWLVSYARQNFEVTRRA